MTRITQQLVNQRRPGGTARGHSDAHESRPTGARDRGRSTRLIPVKIFLTLGLSACAGQSIPDGPATRPAAQATISAQSKLWLYTPFAGNVLGATIESVDGSKVNARTSKVSISPGVHKLSVTCIGPGISNTQELTVHVIAGGQYKLVGVYGGPESCESLFELKSRR